MAAPACALGDAKTRRLRKQRVVGRRPRSKPNETGGGERPGKRWEESGKDELETREREEEMEAEESEAETAREREREREQKSVAQDVCFAVSRL